MKPIVVVPTYNEIENLERIVGLIREQPGGFHILIVDDNSPDAACASPSIRVENPELVSSPRSWAGRQHNQPAATSKPLPRSAAPLPLKQAPVVEAKQATEPMREMHRRPGESQEGYEASVKLEREIAEILANNEARALRRTTSQEPIQ